MLKGIRKQNYQKLDSENLEHTACAFMCVYKHKHEYTPFFLWNTLCLNTEIKYFFSPSLARVSSKLIYSKIWKSPINFSSVGKLLPIAYRYNTSNQNREENGNQLSSLLLTEGVISYKKASPNLKKSTCLYKRQVSTWSKSPLNIHLTENEEGGSWEWKKQEHMGSLLFANCYKMYRAKSCCADFRQTPNSVNLHLHLYYRKYLNGS